MHGWWIFWVFGDFVECGDTNAHKKREKNADKESIDEL